MISEFWSCLKTFLIAHRKPLAIWTLFQVLLMATFQSVGLIKPDRDNVFASVAIQVAHVASFYSIVAYIGLAFNTHRKQSWLRQLPFSSATLFFVPVTILTTVSLWYFCTLNDLWRESYLSIGTSVIEFLFLLPFFNFFIIRRSVQPLLGAVVGAAITLSFLFAHETIFWQWNKAQYGLVAEIPYFLAFLAVSLLLEKECKSRVIILAIMAGLLPATFLLNAPLSEPRSLRQSVIDLKIFPTKAAINNFRSFATEAKHWKHEPGQHAVKWSVNRASQSFSRKFLSENDVNLFLKNILDHAQNFAILEQEREPFSYSDPFPLDPSNLGDTSKSFLLANWKDDPAYCHFLPRDLKSDYLAFALASKSCGQAIYDFFADHPYPHLDQVEIELLDSVLQSPRENMHKETRDAISRFIRNRSFPKEVDALYTKNSWYDLEPLSDEAVSLFKHYYLLKVRQRIAGWLQLDRQAFENAVIEATEKKNLSGQRQEGKDGYELFVTLRYLCLHLSKNCEGKSPPDQQGTLRYIVEKLRRSKGAESSGGVSEERFLLAQEILKMEHWPILENLEILSE
jgi:hypothetical protein